MAVSVVFQPALLRRLTKKTVKTMIAALNQGRVK